MSTGLQEPKSVSSHLTADDAPPAEPTREIPKWALILGLIAFVVFNALFLVFAMSLGSGNPG